MKNGVRFFGKQAEVCLWAPLAKKASLYLPEKGTRIPLQEEPFGYWKLKTKEIQPGEHYWFQLDEGQELPDPASLSQPQGVHGPSQALDLQDFRWTDVAWETFPLSAYLLYEVHTGTFTPEGNFKGVEKKLDHLKELGVNAVEIMPVAQFPGSRNWGYDGVFPYAVQHSYGGARALQRLVNRCHEKGLAVVLDVVYNHLGPEGNYLAQFAPYFTGKYQTPWGKAINFDDAWCDGVRRYFIDNALMWFRDFHIDALRLDAVHAIKDLSPVHLLREIKEQVLHLEDVTGKRHYLIAECDLNDTRFIRPVDEEGYGMDAQWLDEFHHALRVTSGQERIGYYADFDGIEHLAKAYRDAYVFDGSYSPHRHRTFGTSANGVPGHRFIVFSQNHDQAGNRMLGERTSRLHSFEMQKLLAGAVFSAPYLPMLFMGEEWSESNPFLYFVSHTDPELVEAVRKGRQSEFSAFHLEGSPPDPQAEETFLQSRLQWELLDREPHRTLFQYYQALISLRKQEPILRRPQREGLETFVLERQQVLLLLRGNPERQVLCLMNFSSEQQLLELPASGRLPAAPPAGTQAGSLLQGGSREVPAPEKTQRAAEKDPAGKGFTGKNAAESSWKKALDSASPRWNGPAAAPERLKDGDRISLQPESFIVYSRTLSLIA